MFDFQPGLVLPQIYLVLFGVLALIVGLASAPDGWLWHSLTPAAMAIVGLLLAIEAQGALLFVVLPKARTMAVSQFGGALSIDAAGAMFGLVALLSVLWAAVMSLAELQNRFKGQGLFYCLLLIVAASAVTAPYASSLAGIFLCVTAVTLTSAALLSVRVSGNPHPPLPFALLLSAITLIAALGVAVTVTDRVMVSSNMADIGVRLQLGSYEAGPVFRALVLIVSCIALGGPLWLLLPGSVAAARRTQLSALPALFIAAPAAGIGMLLRLFSMAPQSGVISIRFLVALSLGGVAVGLWLAFRAKTLRSVVTGHALVLGAMSLAGIAAFASNPRVVSALAIRVQLMHLTAVCIGLAAAITVVVVAERFSGSSAFETVTGFTGRVGSVALGLVIGLLTLAGLPPTVGLPGRFELVTFSLSSATPAGRLMAWTIVAASVICLYYLFRVARLVFSHDSPDTINHKPHPAAVSLLWISVAIPVLLFALNGPLGRFLTHHSWMYYRLR
ncbi:MAG: hypothetical protein IT209_07485 [Armatimonadetes bacterium]|nr:hypothetical protein [Armatimonadota bacterium]